MRVAAEIEVERGDDMVLVPLNGRFEHYGSYNPQERGLSLESWDSNGFLLTPSESEYAISALYEAAQ